MKEWLSIAFAGPVVRRGLRYAAVVGAILILINHGDAVLSRTVGPVTLAQMGLTILVPYCVSVLSSVGAILDTRADARSPARGSAP